MACTGQRHSEYRALSRPCSVHIAHGSWGPQGPASLASSEVVSGPRTTRARGISYSVYTKKSTKHIHGEFETIQLSLLRINSSDKSESSRVASQVRNVIFIYYQYQLSNGSTVRVQNIFLSLSCIYQIPAPERRQMAMPIAFRFSENLL